MDVYSRIKPFCPPFIGTPGLIQPLNLLLKDKKNGTGRFAGFELSGEWMCKEIVLCESFVFVQRIVDDLLEVGGR